MSSSETPAPAQQTSESNCKSDVIENAAVRRKPQTIIERVTEQPRKPPSRFIDSFEDEPIIKQS